MELDFDVELDFKVDLDFNVTLAPASPEAPAPASAEALAPASLEAPAPASLCPGHCPCGLATRSLLDSHEGQVCAWWAAGARRYAESRKSEATAVHTHTHTHTHTYARDRYPMLQEDKRKLR